MIDERTVLQVLVRHLGCSVPRERLEAISRDIVATTQQWEEVPLKDTEMGYTASLELVDVCFIDRLLNEGYEVRIFKSRKPVRPPGFLERLYRKYLLRSESSE